MAYSQDLTKSARRHLRAANELHNVASAGAQPGCKAVAGYLYGLSGELAVKAMMRESGMTPLPPNDRRNDPFYAHFPDLKTKLRDAAQGRRAAALRVIAESSIFRNWATEMRYARTSDIADAWIEEWRVHAHELVDRMDE